MPGVAVAHLTISRLGGASDHISRFDMGDAGQALKNGLSAPEAAAAENCCLLFRHGRLDVPPCPKFRVHVKKSLTTQVTEVHEGKSWGPLCTPVPSVVKGLALTPRQ